MNPIETQFPDMPDRDSFVTVCFCCGWPLDIPHIAVDFEGEVTDYDMRQTNIPVKFALCRECFTKGKSFIDEGVDAAYRRLYISCILKEGHESGNPNPIIGED